MIAFCLICLVGLIVVVGLIGIVIARDLTGLTGGVSLVEESLEGRGIERGCPRLHKRLWFSDNENTQAVRSNIAHLWLAAQ